MRYIKGLTKDTLKLLKRIYKQSKYYQVRQRAHCIKLSYQGYKISELMEIFQVSRNTIYNWFHGEQVKDVNTNELSSRELLVPADEVSTYKLFKLLNFCI